MFLLKCAVLLIAAILVHSEELSQECRLEMLGKSYGADACIARLQRKSGSIEQLMQDFNHTVVYYSGNEVDFESVNPLINKFLTLLPQYCDCVLGGYEYSDECPRSIESSVRKLYLEQMAIFMTNELENNGEKIKKLIPHNGLAILLSNNDMKQCIDIIVKIPNMDEFCPALGRANHCAAEVIGNHPNHNVLPIVEEFVTMMKEAYC